MKRLLSICILLLTIIPGVHAQIPDSQMRPFYGVRWFVSADGQDTLAISYSGDTIQFSATGDMQFRNNINVDTINEYTTDNGVNIEGTLFKDNDINTDIINVNTALDINIVATPISCTGTIQSGTGLEIGNYYYRISYITDLGESTPKLSSVITTTSGNQQILLTLPVSSDIRVIGRKIYRTVVDGYSFYMGTVTTINNNIDINYVDSVADNNLTNVGYESYYKVNTTANFITISGQKAMTLDIQKTAFGFGAGNSGNGGENTYVGKSAGSNTGSGSRQTFIGSNAGASAIGGNVVIVGTNAGKSSTGNNNVILGSYAGFNLTGNDGVFIGTHAGYTSSKLITGSGNIAIGRKALSNYNDDFSGANNIFLGTQAGKVDYGQVPTTSNSIALGYKSYTTKSNQVVLGNTDVVETLLRGNVLINNTLDVDAINEYTTDNGVLIDDVSVKDGRVFNPTNTEPIMSSELVNKKYSNENGYLSTGAIANHLFTNNSNGTVTIEEGEVILYSNDTFVGARHKYLLHDTTFTPSSTASSYVIARYNNGNPIYDITEDVEIINESDVIPIYTLFTRDNINYQKLNWTHTATGLSNRLHMRAVKLDRFARENGLIISESSGRQLNLTAGKIWYGGNRISLDITDSDNKNLTLWTKTAGIWEYTDTSQYPNTLYQDGDNVVTMSNNKYGIIWVYRTVVGDKLGCILGGAEYTRVIDAEAALIPQDKPDAINTHGILVGRIIFGKDDTEALTVTSAFKEVFNIASVTSHQNLSDLQGGVAGEYYHLSNTEYTSATRDATENGNGLMPANKLNAWDSAYGWGNHADLYVSLTENENIGGEKTFTSFPITPSTAPTSDYQVCNKKYVDDNAGGGSVAGSNRDIQFNDNGSFGADDNFSWDGNVLSATPSNGVSNLFIGVHISPMTGTGQSNTCIGYDSGGNLSTGAYNTFIGYDAGSDTYTGQSNVYIGHRTGYNNSGGNQNIFIGRQAGWYETGSNKLYIESSSSTTPLIYGEFDNDSLVINGDLHVTGNFSASGGGGSGSPLTTKGDLFTYSTEDARLPVGANDNILMASSTETTGLKWGNIADINYWTKTGNDVYFNGGKVGIGTNSPEAKLHIKSSSTSSNSIVVENSLGNDILWLRETSNSDGQLNIQNSSGVANTVINSNGNSYFNGGNVGINDATPSYELDVTGTGRFTKGRKPAGSAHSNLGTYNALFDALSPAIPNTGDEIIVSGSLHTASTYIVNRVVRNTSATMKFYGMTTSGSITTLNINNGDGNSIDYSLSW